MLAAVPLMIVLRLFHILAGVLWVGSSFLFNVFIGPSAAEVGPSAGPLLSAVVKERKVTKVIKILAMVTVTAGWLMWFRDLDQIGSLGDWLGTNYGLVLTIGGILATIALFDGIYGVGNNVERLVDLSDEIRASGGPPSDEQMVRMGSIQTHLKKHGQFDLIVLLLAVAAMSTARYW